MRKKQLIEELNRSNERIRQLEDLICPAESHEWKVYQVTSNYNYLNECFDHDYFYICKKCRKEKITSRLV